MNVQNLFPNIPGPAWEVIRDLATRDWLKLKSFDERGPEFLVDVNGLQPRTAQVLRDTTSGMYNVEGGPSKDLAWLYSLSRVIAEGPKMFRPTAEQCFSLEHVELSIPMTDYRQCYPTMIVEFPLEYRKDIDRRTGGVPACPRSVIVRYFEGGMVVTGCSIIDFNSLPAELVYVFGSKAKEGTLEDVMGIYLNTNSAETALLEAMTRVALNLMLLLAQTGSRLTSTDPAGLAKCRERLKKGIRPDLQRREIAEHVQVVVPDRQIVVRDTRRMLAEGPGTHASPSLHWRRGHWRAHPGFGEARGRGEKVPLVFVRPCLVGVGEEPAAPCYSVK